MKFSCPECGNKFEAELEITDTKPLCGKCEPNLSDISISSNST